MIRKNCSVCNVGFVCDSSPAGGDCWCSSYPAIMPANFDQDCRCSECLARAIADRINVMISSSSHDEMIEMASAYANGGALAEHIDFTIENGNHVFTRWYHLKRGSCCGNGCRHCPYPA